MSTFYTWRQAVIKSKLPPTTRHVLLTLGCHMNDMGESCYPSIDTLCEETGLSNRAVITHLKVAIDAGFICCDRHGFSGQKWARNEYKATFPAPKSDENLSKKAVNEVHHLNDKAVNVVPEGSERSDVKAVNVVHTNYTVNYSINKSSQHAQPDAQKKPAMRPEGRYAIRLQELLVNATSINPTLQQWIADKIELDFIVECVAIARMYKPSPERISIGYLNSIVRTKLAEVANPRVDMSWLMSDEGVIAKGREVGIDAKVGESMQDYRARLKSIVQGGNERAA